MSKFSQCSRNDLREENQNQNQRRCSIVIKEAILFMKTVYLSVYFQSAFLIYHDNEEKNPRSYIALIFVLKSAEHCFGTWNRK